MAPGRHPTKRRDIEQYIRSSIASGRFGPDTKLPTRRKLCERFSASPGTIQGALDGLVRQGFVEARGPRGTFVASAPPHLSHYALVIPQSPQSRQGAWIRFWTALANEAAAVSQQGDKRVDVIYGSEDGTASEAHQRLARLISEQRLAGVISPHRPIPFVDEPLLKRAGVIPVAITGAHPGTGETPEVELDLGAFVRRAIAKAADAGRTRLALLVAFGTPGIDRWHKQAARRGIEIRPHWIHGIDPSTPGTTRSLVRLLMNRDQRVRPDALVIADDNLVEYATGGLVDEGVRVPKDLTVIAHCNFPWPTPSVVPVHRLGYDARRVLAECIACVDAGRLQKGPMRRVKIAPVFEDELDDAEGGK